MRSQKRILEIKVRKNGKKEWEDYDGKRANYVRIYYFRDIV